MSLAAATHGTIACCRGACKVAEQNRPYASAGTAYAVQRIGLAGRRGGRGVTELGREYRRYLAAVARVPTRIRQGSGLAETIRGRRRPRIPAVMSGAEAKRDVAGLTGASERALLVCGAAETTSSEQNGERVLRRGRVRADPVGPFDHRSGQIRPGCPAARLTAPRARTSHGSRRWWPPQRRARCRRSPRATSAVRPLRAPSN